MILPKLIRYLLLSCLISIVFTQTESSITAIESSSITESIVAPTTTSTPSNSTSSTSLIEPTTTTTTTTTINTNNSTSSLTPTTTIFTSTSNNADAFPTVQTPGWNSNGNIDDSNQQSWLRQHNRFVFVIFLGLIFLSVLIWYIVRSVKGMRKRLEQENQAQLYMMQQARSPPPPQQQQHQQQQQRNDRVIPELTPSPPPTYKTEDHSIPPQTVNNAGQSNY
ncbi:hypothetical protein MFLAVUS_009879 [Mucor flavus]|uniref:Uncharacterized protein n=1 Tax=Mucor flavus TaxID=439312 RepID=A0ABP9ZB86_9FUNG